VYCSVLISDTTITTMGYKSSFKDEDIVTLQHTLKFSVLNLRNINQPNSNLNFKKKSFTNDELNPANTKVGTNIKIGIQGRRAVASSGPRIGNSSSNMIAGTCFQIRTKNPSWILSRRNLYEKFAARRAEELCRKTPRPIYITMLDGNILKEKKNGEKFMSWCTTPFDVASLISNKLANESVVARITYENYVFDYSLAEDGMSGKDFLMESIGSNVENFVNEESYSSNVKDVLWDMTRPLVGNIAKFELLTFESDNDAKTVFWHSSAHILGEALEHLYGCRLTIGPPLKGGFYYDCYMGTDDAFSEDDYAAVEAEFSNITKAKQKFERLVVTKDEALELFAGNPFKEQIIMNKVPDNTRTSVYRCFDLIDLCRGPHLPHTGRVRAFAATKHSATKWLADTNNDDLQRIYGISFPERKMLKFWKETQEEAKKRDHRRVIQKQELVMFHDLSPGSAFWLPHGTRIYNKLIDFIKSHYWKHGYYEIITPNIYNLDLWDRSGHSMHYKDSMFCFSVEEQNWAMKPMNCPGHCLMFANSVRSYRDLPLRLAEFGILHRNELSGTLTGLLRVRRFQQDDAHIYCREDQIEEEVLGALEFMKSVYATFGMKYKLELSTRPKHALGNETLWDHAEIALSSAMNTFAGKGTWRTNPGDGAFYGPKIDVKVLDAMERVHQCATVQLDFQLPIRFDLQYKTGSKELGKEFARPVMIHRAMLGSVERMFAILCEHWGGKWPFWISPRQVMVIPVHAEFNDYCQIVRKRLHNENFCVDVDLSKATFQKKIRNAQVSQYNFQLVVGKNEVMNGTVNMRTRENVIEGEMKVDDMILMLKNICKEFK